MVRLLISQILGLKTLIAQVQDSMCLLLEHLVQVIGVGDTFDIPGGELDGTTANDCSNYS